MNGLIDFGVDSISVIVHKYEEGSFSFKNEKRAWDGFVMFTDGNGTYTDSKGSSYAISKGTIIFLNLGDKYEIKSVDSCSYVTSGLFFTKESSEFLSQLPPTMSCTPKQVSEICEICKLWQTHRWDSLLLCKIKIMSLYLDLYRSHVTHSNNGDYDIEKAKEYIHRYFGKEYSYDTLCLLMSLSPSYLRYKFKKNTGVTITEYRERLRISSAAEMLESGHFTLSEIAFELGYFDVYHFSKAFKTITGYPPGKYKNSK